MSRKARRAISRSHDRSIEENVNINYIISGTQWSVPSFTDPDEVYVVEKNVDPERCWSCEKAGLICVPCNICGHSYSCTCPDYLINDNICKHIHRVVIESTHQTVLHHRSSGRKRVNSGLQQTTVHEEGAGKNIKITNIFDHLWLVPSFTDPNKVYAIERNDEEDCECNEKCEECNICIHSFSCTCPSFVTASSICKHIHKVAWETVEERSASSDSDCRSTGSWAEFAWTKLTPVERRHESSVNTRVEVNKISESKYLVPSFTDSNVVYTVESNGIANCSTCKNKNRCNYCNICVHAYTCTCPDYDQHFIICKHIHKVACQKNIEVLTVDE